MTTTTTQTRDALQILRAAADRAARQFGWNHPTTRAAQQRAAAVAAALKSN